MKFIPFAFTLVVTLSHCAPTFEWRNSMLPSSPVFREYAVRHGDDDDDLFARHESMHSSADILGYDDSLPWLDLFPSAGHISSESDLTQGSWVQSQSHGSPHEVTNGGALLPTAGSHKQRSCRRPRLDYSTLLEEYTLNGGGDEWNPTPEEYAQIVKEEEEKLAKRQKRTTLPAAKKLTPIDELGRATTRVKAEQPATLEKDSVETDDTDDNDDEDWKPDENDLEVAEQEQNEPDDDWIPNENDLSPVQQEQNEPGLVSPVWVKSEPVLMDPTPALPDTVHGNAPLELALFRAPRHKASTRAQVERERLDNVAEKMKEHRGTMSRLYANLGDVLGLDDKWSNPETLEVAVNAVLLLKGKDVPEWPKYKNADLALHSHGLDRKSKAYNELMLAHQRRRRDFVTALFNTLQKFTGRISRKRQLVWLVEKLKGQNKAIAKALSYSKS